MAGSPASYGYFSLTSTKFQAAVIPEQSTGQSIGSSQTPEAGALNARVSAPAKPSKRIAHPSKGTTAKYKFMKIPQ